MTTLLLLLLSPSLFSPLRHCGGAGPGPPRPSQTHVSAAATAAVAMAVPQQLSSGQTLLRSAFLSSGRKTQKLILTRCPLRYSFFFFVFSFLVFEGGPWGGCQSEEAVWSLNEGKT